MNAAAGWLSWRLRLPGRPAPLPYSRTNWWRERLAAGNSTTKCWSWRYLRGKAASFPHHSLVIVFLRAWMIVRLALVFYLLIFSVFSLFDIVFFCVSCMTDLFSFFFPHIFKFSSVVLSSFLNSSYFWCLYRWLSFVLGSPQGNIRVFCRVRPLIGEEIKNNGDSDVIHHINFIDERTLELCKGGGKWQRLTNSYTSPSLWECMELMLSTRSTSWTLTLVLVLYYLSHLFSSNPYINSFN